MLDMMKMMGRMKELQARLQQAQNNLINIKAVGEAGGGMVKVTANGKKQLLTVEIDEALMKPSDRQVLQDLIVAAVNKALDEAEQLAREELRKSTEGLLPDLPGLDLGNLMR
ncbi:MAG: YbaB/EbfC family nucleoid-associated protein [Cyclobacteriaceae bacterium]|nr:YbaB/EbfC family nucleoid-associated protein [Cyclobacteriaceae bacterium]